MAGTIAFCTTEYADTFLNVHRWNENWTGASTSEKEKALLNATNVILMFVLFKIDEQVKHLEGHPTSTTDSTIQDWLKQACCYEALYFLDLDNDPARPFPLAILGLLKSGQETFDKEYVPPLFSEMARKMLENNGCIVDDPYNNDNDFGRRKMIY